jgi:hypothetical protein
VLVAGYFPLDVLAVPADTLAYSPPARGRVLVGVTGNAAVLASARGGWMSCAAWALPTAERKALAARLRSLAWLVEICVPDEAESRAG